MAKFVCDVDLNMTYPLVAAIGPAGTTHRVPDSLYEEFDEDFGTGRIPGLVWLVTDEIAALTGEA